MSKPPSKSLCFNFKKSRVLPRKVIHVTSPDFLVTMEKMEESSWAQQTEENNEEEEFKLPKKTARRSHVELDERKRQHNTTGNLGNQSSSNNIHKRYRIDVSNQFQALTSPKNTIATVDNIPSGQIDNQSKQDNLKIPPIISC